MIKTERIPKINIKKNMNQFFRKSLDKYKFNLEVYVPNSM